MTNRPQTGRRYRTAAPARGKREQPASRRGDRHLRQLAVSGVVLLAVVLVKISAPAAMDKCRDKLLDLMGGQTDFRAAFSAVGRAVSGQGPVGQALNDAYTAVFGPQQTVPEGTADPVSRPVYGPEASPKKNAASEAAPKAGKKGAEPAAAEKQGAPAADAPAKES